MSEIHIPLSDLDYGCEEEAAVLRVLKSKWLSMGPETKAFEEEFASLVGTRHALAVSNGSAALHMAFLALDLQPGDEVIQPSVNFVAAANMSKALGATPVFCDILSLEEPTMDPAELERLITPRTKAVVVMHYGGYPCRMAEIIAICSKHQLPIVEDACHAVGAKYFDGLGRVPHGLMAGNLGDIACFSFFSNKNIAVGEGGMITTNRDDLAEKVRLLRSHGMSTLTWDRHRGHASSYDVLAHGYNCRIDDIRSALGRTQLAKLMPNNQRRWELTCQYWQCLPPLLELGWTLPYKNSYVSRTSEYPPAAHLLPVVAPNPGIRSRCAGLLKDVGIQTSLHYPMIQEFTAFHEDQETYSTAKAKCFCENVITLPMHPNLTTSQIEIIAGKLFAYASTE